MKDLLSQLDQIDADIKKAEQQSALVQQISAIKGDDSQDTDNNAPANSDDSADDADDEEDSGKVNTEKTRDFGTQFVKAYEKKTGLDYLTKRPFSMEAKAATDT